MDNCSCNKDSVVIINNRNKYVALAIALTVGQMGIHKCYLGDVSTGKMMFWVWLVSLFTIFIYIGILGLVVLSIIAIVNSIQIAFMGEDEFNQKYNTTKIECKI